MHGLPGGASVANPAVPDPVVVPLEFFWNGRVGRVGRSQFRMGTVVAGLTIDPVIHVALCRIHQQGVAVEGVGVFTVRRTVAVAALRHIQPGSTAALYRGRQGGQITVTVETGLSCPGHDSPHTLGLRAWVAIVTSRRSLLIGDTHLIGMKTVHGLR